MFSRPRLYLTYIGALGVIAFAAFAFFSADRITVTPDDTLYKPQKTQVATVEPFSPVASPPTSSTTASATTSGPLLSIPPTHETQYVQDTRATISRIESPYLYLPLPFSEINERTRSALVNILCISRSGSLRPTSASGVIIDPRGVVLTNAHVAQYVLLAQSGKVSLSCSVRAGAPARLVGGAEVLFMPAAWAQRHAKDITNPNPMGTGEYDYALIRITPLPDSLFPWIPFDTREGIGFTGDIVLAASYPSEFIGSLATLHDLYAVSSISPIQELLTFEEKTADLISLGSVIEAQSGSSGGPVVNAWGQLIGIITTTSEGATTAERELRALALSYINRDLAAHAGVDLRAMLAMDLMEQSAQFQKTLAPILIQLLIEGLKSAR